MYFHFVSLSVYQNRRERDLLKRIELQNVRMSHMKQELESTREAQRIVLDTKESVMRSLLKQNSQISQEVTDWRAFYGIV